MTIIGKVKNINQMDVKKDFFISSRVTNVHKPNPDKPEIILLDISFANMM
jgi:hypothetical protein